MCQWSRQDIFEAYWVYFQPRELPRYSQVKAKLLRLALSFFYLPEMDELTANGKEILKTLKERYGQNGKY